MENGTDAQRMRDALRNHPAFVDLPGLLLEKLIEGLDAMEVKTSSYQGEIVKSEEFIDYSVRLNYIKFLCVLGDFCSTESLDNAATPKSELSREQLQKRATELQRQLGIGNSTEGDAGTRRNAGSSQAKKRAK